MKKQIIIKKQPQNIAETSSISELIKNSDDYFKIAVAVWLKLREIYFDTTSKIPLNKKIEKFIKASKVIRKQCKNVGKAQKLAYILKMIEEELQSGKQMVEKLAKISTIVKIFDLPEPIMMLIDKLGLDNIRDKDDDFADLINELFAGDEIIKDNQELQEGTLVNFAKKKFVANEDDKLEQRNVKLHFKKEDEELEDEIKQDNLLKPENYLSPQGYSSLHNQKQQQEHYKNSQNQLINQMPQIINQMPQIINQMPQITNEIPQFINEIPQFINQISNQQQTTNNHFNNIKYNPPSKRPSLISPYNNLTSIPHSKYQFQKVLNPRGIGQY